MFNGLSLLVSYSEKNFFGCGQVVDFKISVFEFVCVFNFDFIELYLFGWDLVFNFDMIYCLIDNEGVSYDIEIFCISFVLIFVVSDVGCLRIYVVVEYGDIIDLLINIVLFIVVDVVEGGLWILLFGYFYSWDNCCFGLNFDMIWVFCVG